MSTQHTQKKKIGVTLGAFDLCHAGHMMVFKEAKTVCDYLIVGLQDDPSLIADVAYRDKIKNRPVMTIEERRIMLEGIKYIDEIFTYTTEADLYEKLKKLTWDIRIIGIDWKGKKFTGWDLPKEVYYNSRNHNLSTSELRKRVYQAEVERMANETKSSSYQKVGKSN